MSTFGLRRLEHVHNDGSDRLMAIVDEILDHDWWQQLPPWWEDYIASMLANRPDWWGKASRDEVLAFGLCQCTCGTCEWDNAPDGSSIAAMSTDAIRSLLLLASQRLSDPSKRSRWLEGYSAQLVTESRRRRGVG